MNRISSQKKLKDVDRLLSEVRAKIKELKKGEAVPNEKVVPRAKAATKIADKTVKHRKRAIQGIDLKAEYEELYEGFVSGKIDTIRDYIMGRDKVFLKEFCRVNNLPIDAARASKNIILDQVMLWMSRRKAISKTPP
jgi:hypothetical protein